MKVVHLWGGEMLKKILLKGKKSKWPSTKGLLISDSCVDVRWHKYYRKKRQGSSVKSCGTASVEVEVNRRKQTSNFEQEFPTGWVIKFGNTKNYIRRLNQLKLVREDDYSYTKQCRYLKVPEIINLILNARKAANKNQTDYRRMPVRAIWWSDSSMGFTFRQQN